MFRRLLTSRLARTPLLGPIQIFGGGFPGTVSQSSQSCMFFWEVCSLFLLEVESRWSGHLRGHAIHFQFHGESRSATHQVSVPNGSALLQGWTPLHLAVQSGDESNVAAVLAAKLGSSVSGAGDVSSCFQWSPFAGATRTG